MRYNVEIIHIESTSKRLSTEENAKVVHEYQMVASL